MSTANPFSAFPFSSFPFASMATFDSAAVAELVELQQTQLARLQALSGTALASSEKFAALSLSTARSLIENSTLSAQSLLSQTGAPDFSSLQSKLIAPLSDTAKAWGLGAYAIQQEAQSALSGEFEAQVSAAKVLLETGLEKFKAAAPAGTEPLVSASISNIKAGLAALDSGYESFIKTLHQFSEAATVQAAPAAKAASKARKA